MWPFMQNKKTFVIDISPTIEKVIDRLLCYLEGRGSKEAQRKVDAATADLAKSNAEAQAVVDDASKS
jgi:hypothetical protein